MITSLFDSNNVLITDRINEAILNPEIMKVTNKLLDGTYHIQTIGQRIDIISIKCYVTRDKKEMLDNAYVINELIRLDQMGRYYNGFITNMSQWVMLTRNVFEINIELVVRSEGII